MDEKIQTKIPVIFVGTPPATKKGLLVVTVLNEIEVESLPGALPKNFEVDLSSLEKEGDAISVNDLKIPVGVKVLVPPETIIVTVTEKEEEPISAAAPISPSISETAPSAAEETPTQTGKNQTAPNVK